MKLTRYSGKRHNRERFTWLRRSLRLPAPIGTIAAENVYWNAAGKPRALRAKPTRKQRAVVDKLS